jgi:hypothetical protein
MNTSKTLDLKTFRMNTYRKTGVGEPYMRVNTKLSIDRPFNPVKMHPLNARLEHRAAI